MFVMRAGVMCFEVEEKFRWLFRKALEDSGSSQRIQWYFRKGIEEVAKVKISFQRVILH